MADPLSVAASIAGLISLADVVFTRLVKYGKAVKNAEKELKELTKDVNLLGGSLDSLSRLARALEDGSFNKGLHMDYIDECNETLEEMKEKLGKVEADSAKGKLFWPGRSSRLKVWREDISRHQRMISAALSADTLQALLQILSHENQQREEILSEIRDTRSIVSRVDKESRRSKVEAFFLKCNPQENYEMSLQLRHPRTGLWLINRLPQFRYWLATPKSKLWLKGIPGAGKTVLAGSIIEATLSKSTETNSIATAFFFCDYKNPVTQSIETILGVLAYQLSIQNKDAYELLVQYYDELHPKQALPRTPDISSLKVLLQKVLEMYDHVYLILDGLDECGNMTEDVIDVLVDTFDEADNISAALLSRDEDGIRDRLSDCCVSIEVAAHKHDIMEYVTAQIQERIRVGKLSAYDPELKAEIIQGLVDGAKGMFRWVSCQLDHLKDCISDQDCRDALLALPPTLDETYARILRRVPKGKRRLVQLALQFIAYASPKLTIRQLREALSVPERDTLLEPRQIIHLNAISKYCSSLVRESTDGQYLEFSHFSVQEFLKTISSQDTDLVGFAISERLSHRLLAVECLRFLQLRNFYRLRFDPDTEKKEIADRERDFPFYSYAAEHWSNYARHSWDDAEVLDLAKLLFHPNKSPYFISWAISLARTIGDIAVRELTTDFADPSFTPLHMASALSLEEICSFLIEQGANVNVKSEAGCPLQCAVQGLLFMSADRDGDDCDLAEIMGGYHGTMASEKTVECLHHAGASLDTTSTQIFPGESLLEVAFRSALLTGRLSVPTVLIRLGINIQEKSLERADVLFRDFNDGSAGQRQERYTTSLQPFIESLDHRNDRSEATLRLCSLAWEAALCAQLEFTFDVMAIDTRITLSPGELEARAIAAIKACNLQVLKKIMADPRFKASEISHNDDEENLLHLALEQFSSNIEKNLEITRLLLDAGCDIHKSNRYGQQPLHMWDEYWLAMEDAGQQPYHEMMHMITEMGVTCVPQDKWGRNALHDHMASPYHFQAILDTQSVENIETALEAVDEDGFTPLALSLRSGAWRSVSLLAKKFTITPRMTASPVPVLSLAANADSDGILDILIPLTCNPDFRPQENPLHHMGPGATASNIRRLKSLYPDACNYRPFDRTPLESYFERCLEQDAVTEIDEDVMDELSMLNSNKDRGSDYSKVWERFAQHATASKSEEIVTSVGLSLLRLGYMVIFENQDSNSGILPILSSFSGYQTTIDLKPISTTLLCQILRQTAHKSKLLEEPQILRLLSLAARSLDFELASLLLVAGVSVHRRVDGLSVLETFCKGPPDVSAKPEAKQMFELLLQYAESRQLNECNPRGNGLAAIHLLPLGAEWMIETLVLRGADPNLPVKDQWRETPMVHHLYNQRRDLALALLSNGADPSLVRSGGWDAALKSAQEGDVLMLAAIFAADNTRSNPRVNWERTGSVENRNGDGFHRHHDNVNGLHIAASRGHTQVINFYLENSLIRDLEAKTSHGWTPLHFAAKGGRLDTIKVLCGHGANVNARCDAGLSPLHLAVLYSQLASAKALVDAGGNPFADFNGCKPSFYTNMSKHQSLNEWILSIEREHTDESPANNTAGLETTSGPALSTICATAILENQIPKLELLAVKNFDFESPLSNCEGCSALIYAIRLGRVNIVRWLLQHGAAITQLVHCGKGVRTGLHFALEKVALADIIPDCLKNFTNNGGLFLGQSPTLIHATLHGDNLKGLNHLLTYLAKTEHDIDRKQQKISRLPENLLRAAVSESDSQDGTPLVYAVRYKSLAAIKMLLDFGADVNGTTQFSLNTPLHEAIMTGDVEVVSLLIDRGSDLEVRNRDGQTPLFLASANQELIDVLLGANADRTVLNRFHCSFLDKLSYYISGSCRTFEECVRSGVNPHTPHCNVTAFHRAIASDQFVSYILNSDFRIDDSRPFYWGGLGSPPAWINAGYRLFRKKYQTEGLKLIANLMPSDCWSPLCRFASEGAVKPMENLIDLDCSLDYEGCPLGSALMVACANGRMMSVELLVRRGACLTYSGPNGYRSAYLAATNRKEILKWLLVGRFIGQSKLTSSYDLSDIRKNCHSSSWGGPVKIEVVISGGAERWPRESSQAYWSRLMAIKTSWRGKVPPLDPRRRTARPAKLIPQEVTRICGGGYEKPGSQPNPPK